jgi:hypothetical protein
MVSFDRFKSLLFSSASYSSLSTSFWYYFKSPFTFSISSFILYSMSSSCSLWRSVCFSMSLICSFSWLTSLEYFVMNSFDNFRDTHSSARSSSRFLRLTEYFSLPSASYRLLKPLCLCSKTSTFYFCSKYYAYFYWIFWISFLQAACPSTFDFNSYSDD